MDDEEYEDGKNESESNEKSDEDREQQSEGENDESVHESQHRNNDEERNAVRHNLTDTAIFNEEEIQNLKDIFDLFDKDQSGKIEISDLENILTSLKRDPEEAKQMLKEIDPNHEGEITFQEFIKLMAKIENKMDKKGDAEEQDSDKKGDGDEAGKEDGKRTTIQTDSRVLDFLILLEDYRCKCEGEGKYAEARKARIKYEELLRKETIRQKNNIRIAQEQELQSIENAQKSQFLEFSQAWDNYMSDYEATAYLSLEKLKEKHLLEFQQFSDNIAKEMRKKMKFSKDLIELRDKEAKLVKMKRYEEAEKIKIKADLLEQFERNKMEGEIQAVIEKKESKLRHKQQLALAALLKRIQRDRNEQLKHRQIDSQRLIQRNKNILNDLINKQNQETKRTLEMLKKTLASTKKDQTDHKKN